MVRVTRKIFRILVFGLPGILYFGKKESGSIFGLVFIFWGIGRLSCELFGANCFSHECMEPKRNWFYRRRLVNFILVSRHWVCMCTELAPNSLASRYLFFECSHISCLSYRACFFGLFQFNSLNLVLAKNNNEEIFLCSISMLFQLSKTE